MFFGGMKNLNCGYFWGSSQNWAILGGHFYTFKGVSRYKKGIFLGIAKISNIFSVCLLEGKQFMLGPSLCIKKQVAQWAMITHLGASIMFGDTIIYDA